ncbi:hypothetical protein B0T17DRAFT_605855 [Bombardia bombarda]|uniref:Indoleamine 2,3-dioxygenase n=1 Tax=Bombardia bombarda TaxID=252184 RepID=A0AA39XQX4_9PEZI|nr:hypothetical protein B0T17DRAFT_605855 [Bombardia bombarda]
MSPHEIPPTSQPTHIEDNLHILFPEFDISTNGFLPKESPIDRLPNPYYAPWESLIRDLPLSLNTQTLREKVLKLPVLSTADLTTEPEWQRAYAILGLLAHGYIWGGEIPSESWFLMVSVAMEARGAYIIPIMLRALQETQSGRKCDVGLVVRGLDELARCIHDVGALLDRMDEKCDPHVFYHRIRPFLAGSKNMAAAGLPRGVFYDEGEGRGEWRQLRGGSNGQSSLVQFFDVVLGVEHLPGGSGGPDGLVQGGSGKEEMSFHREVRGYMPEPHRRFLEYVAGMGGGGGMRRGVPEVMAVARLEGREEEVLGVKEAFQGATRALAEFRNKHLQIVTRYIIIPSRQERQRQSEDAIKGSALTGTGGTALIPFLKQSRDETWQAGVIEC